MAKQKNKRPRILGSLEFGLGIIVGISLVYLMALFASWNLNPFNISIFVLFRIYVLAFVAAVCLDYLLYKIGMTP